MTDKHKMQLGLTSLVLIFLTLFGVLTQLLGWSLLATGSLLFLLSYPVIWLAWRHYQNWYQTFMQLISYTHQLSAGGKLFAFNHLSPNTLASQLKQAIESMAAHEYKKVSISHDTRQLLQTVLDVWNSPACLFDKDFKLIYRNQTIIECLQKPLLVESHAESLGFSILGQQISHDAFNQNWQTQSIRFDLNGQEFLLFTATNITEQLDSHQRTIQKKLIRVLGHELRNSLTPMSSMAETLLMHDELDPKNTKEVLNRIKQRSDKLLSFVGQYSSLTHLPNVKPTYFEFEPLIKECATMLPKQGIEIKVKGNQQCYGDPEQLAQVFINLLKNAVEAESNESCDITITLIVQQNNQIIEVIDNGPGFANLENVLTPFYTTKSDGSGIGLTLCAEIIHNHGGQFNVSNTAEGHGKIQLSIPLA